MKNGWIILGLLILIIVSVSLLIYPLAIGMVMNVPAQLVAWLLLIASVALIVCIVWLVGWLPQKKTIETTKQSTVAETPKVESTLKTEAEMKVEPSHLEEKKIKTEPSQPPVKEIKDRGSKIIDIEGIGPVYAQKLNLINIHTTSDLLESGATPHGRKELAEKTGISDKLILRWINMADLFRIKGVGEEYSDLLEAAGVDTVVELAKRVSENLHTKMLEVNATKNLVRRPPSLSEVKQWIEEAKTLQRKIEY